MTKETVEAIQAIGSTFTVLAAFAALAVTVRGRAFDAKRAYAEFVLKQRLDSAGTLLGAFAAHNQNLTQVKAVQDAIKGGKLGEDELGRAKEERKRALLALAETMKDINHATGHATVLFRDGLVPHVKSLFDLQRRSTVSGGFDFDYIEANQALAQLAIYFAAELNVSGVLEYQRSLFLPVRHQSKWLQSLNRWN